MKPGTLFFYRDFRFHDGGSADKIIVALGSSQGVTLVVKTTSQGKRYLNDYGCQADHRFPSYHLVKNCCCLEKPTWIVLGEFYELKYAELVQKNFTGDLRRIGELSDDITIDLMKCSIQSDDISSHQASIVQNSIDSFT